MSDITRCSVYDSAEDITSISNALENMLDTSSITRENSIEVSFNIPGNAIDMLNKSELMTETLNTYENLLNASDNILDISIHELSTLSFTNVTSFQSIHGESDTSNPNNSSSENYENLSM